MASLLNWPSQASVRSTTHLCLPNRSLLSTPRRAILGMMFLLRRSFRHLSKSYPLSACSLVGRFLRPLPRYLGFIIGLIASTTSVRALLSWTLAAVQITASGTPWASTTICRLVPGFPLSVGFGPVASPPFWLLLLQNQQQHATNRSCLFVLFCLAAPGVAAPKHRPAASLEGGASR